MGFSTWVRDVEARLGMRLTTDAEIEEAFFHYTAHMSAEEYAEWLSLNCEDF